MRCVCNNKYFITDNNLLQPFIIINISNQHKLIEIVIPAESFVKQNFHHHRCALTLSTIRDLFSFLLFFIYVETLKMFVFSSSSEL